MFFKPFKCTYQVDMITALDLDSEKWIQILFLPLSGWGSHLTFLICANGNNSPPIE